jgi:hypothetical protein
MPARLLASRFTGMRRVGLSVNISPQRQAGRSA